MCLFCKRGRDLIYFPRPIFMMDSKKYQFFHFLTREDLSNWYERFDLWIADNLNISWNEPLDWEGLSEFMLSIKTNYKDIVVTLRISNTMLLKKEILDNIDSVEISLYWHNSLLQERITGSRDSWKFFHRNLETIKTKKNIGISLQTIFIYSNISYSREILEYMLDISNTKIVKIVYPQFMPNDSLSELISKKELLRILIKENPRELLSHVVLQNFPRIPSLTHLFHAIIAS